MKILHINSYYNGGKFYKNLYDKQVNNGLDIEVFVPISSAYEEIDFDYGPYTTLSMNHNPYDRYIFHIKHNKIYNDIEKVYDINEFSLIHAHTLFSNGYIAMKLKKKYGISYVVAVRNTDINIFFKRMVHLRKVGLDILKEADRVIFLSKSYREKLIETYVADKWKESIYNKSLVIANGIDDFWFDNIGSPKNKISGSNLRLVQVGDINKNKNVMATIEAVEILIKRGYKVKLDLVGRVRDTDIYNKIKDFKHANYLGYKTKSELLNIYDNNHIFVLPSIRESFGLVYPEAMSQGLPLIYTRGQGFDKQLKEGQVGYGVDCFDPTDIADKIIKIINRYEEISKACIKLCKNFDWKNISREYYDLYKKILM